MFKILISILVLSMFVFASQRNLKTSSGPYLIYKIDSIHSYYLVYAKKNDSVYKILSKKAGFVSCSQLQVNKDYQMNLFSIWNQDIWVGGVNVNPALNLNVTCLGLDDSTSVCIERDKGIYDLFSTNDLKGLCYQPVVKN